MVGIVITEPLQHIEAGSIGILIEQGKPLGMCTVTHLSSQGEWIVNGDNFSGKIESDMILSVPIVKRVDSEERYPLKFNQWTKTIQTNEINTGKEVTFKLQSAKFVDGHYHRECTECHSHFVGHKRQPWCQKCCDENRTAQIVLTKEKPKLEPKIKRARMINASSAQLLVREAYKMGAEGISHKRFSEWFEKQFKDGTNSTQN